jgi:hypothetical protein
MKKALNNICYLLLFYSLAVFVTACGSAVATEQPVISSTAVQTVPTESTAPTIPAVLPAIPELTKPPYSSAPQDEILDETCRVTINFFFSFKKGFDIHPYRDLFVPSSQPPANSINPPLEALTILTLFPASEWWQRNFPATPIPPIFLPEGPNEYTYYVEFAGHYGPYETPAYIYPDFMTMTMVADGRYSCKIKNHGKG